jgi:uncharacterized protein (DUF3820 family)
MKYVKFPFGKHKGDLIQHLPLTYIVHALETFELPDELVTVLKIQVIIRLDLMDVAHIIREFKKEQVKSGEDYDSDIWNTIPE